MNVHWSDRRRGARTVLATCTSSTDRGLLAWAVGAATSCHARDVIRMLEGEHEASEYACGHVGVGHRYYSSNRRAYTVYEAVAGPVVAVVPWPEVVVALSADLVGAELIAEMRLMLLLRSERNERWWDLSLPSDWCQSPPAVKRRRISAQIEDMCLEYGSLAWERCRPIEHPEPTDLLELLAEMAA